MYMLNYLVVKKSLFDSKVTIIRYYGTWFSVPLSYDIVTDLFKTVVL